MRHTSGQRQLAVHKKVLFAAIPLAALVLLVEAIVRLSGAAHRCNAAVNGPLYVCDPLLYFKMRPDLTPNYEGLNALGFRDREFEDKPPGVFRILALGDSTTFGVLFAPGLTYVDPYPAILESIAAERFGRDRVEVLNAGVPGYNTYHGLTLLRTKLKDLKPDVITVRYGWNDATAASAGDAYRDPDNALMRAVYPHLIQSETYQLARRLRLEFGVPSPASPPSPAAAMAAPKEPAVPLDRFALHLYQIVELGRQQGAEVWLLTEPDALVAARPAFVAAGDAVALAAADEQTRFYLERHAALRDIRETYNLAVKDVAASTGAILVDMVAAYRSYTRDPLFGEQDLVHPLPEGHLLEAELLFSELERRYFSD